MALLIERQLPEEMLNHMVSFASQHTLSKLCLVSKQFNGLATTHLYSKIIIGHNSDIGMERSNISSLAHVLFTSPAHAALVTSVRVLQTWGRIDKECAKICEKHSWPGVGTPELKALAKSKLAKYTLRDEESNAVFEKISSGTDEGGVLAMVVLDLPNLRRLDMNFGLCDDHDAFVAMFELLADHKKIGNVLSWLRVDVIIKGEGDKYPNRTIHVAALLHMPNLRPFYGMKMGDQENDPDLVDGPFAKLKPRSCPVEHLELRTSKLHRGNLQLMMYATILGKLKTPVYGIGYVWAWCDVSHIDIMRSLQLHHGTLERLALSHEVHYPYQHENDDEPYPCDFRPFAALRYRRVASVYVWGHEGFNDPARLADLATKEMLWQILPVNLESSGFEDWSHKNIWMNMKTLHRALKHIVCSLLSISFSNTSSTSRS
jgi:hypothetical protein